MNEIPTYRGSCHCQKVQYTVKADLSSGVVTCNCSICRRTGSVLAFVPSSQFTLERGQGALTDYQFNKKQIHHLFCSICGIRSFARGTGPDGSKMVAINVRCLDGIDVTQLETQQIDGASM